MEDCLLLAAVSPSSVGIACVQEQRADEDHRATKPKISGRAVHAGCKCMVACIPDRLQCKFPGKCCASCCRFGSATEIHRSLDSPGEPNLARLDPKLDCTTIGSILFKSIL